jgi:hypothetical protein
MTKHRSSTHEPKFCPSCKTELLGDYCYNCGERRIKPGDYSLIQFIRQSVAFLTHYDSKLYRSVALLIVKPGFLTEEYFNGRRVLYVKPLQLFFLINILYFLTVSLFGWNTFATHLEIHRTNGYYGSLAQSMVENRIRESNTPIEEYRSHFDHASATLSKTLIFIMIPLLAFLLQLFYWRPKHYYVEHLVFSIHFFSFLLLYLIVTGVPLKLAAVFPNTPLAVVSRNDDVIFTVMVAIGTLVYLLLALKRTRAQSALLTLTKSVLVTYLSYWLLMIYRFILFLICFYFA